MNKCCGTCAFWEMLGNTFVSPRVEVYGYCQRLRSIEPTSSADGKTCELYENDKLADMDPMMLHLLIKQNQQEQVIP